MRIRFRADWANRQIGAYGYSKLPPLLLQAVDPRPDRKASSGERRYEVIELKL